CVTSLHLLFTFSYTTPPRPVFYTLSLHDALPIYRRDRARVALLVPGAGGPGFEQGTASIRGRLSRGRLQTGGLEAGRATDDLGRSEEHTSELQSPYDLVCRLLLEKKNKKMTQSLH